MAEKDYKKILFELEQGADGYPPDRWESVWAYAIEPGLYRVDNIPFYIKGISSDDVVSAEGESRLQQNGRFNRLGNFCRWNSNKKLRSRYSLRRALETANRKYLVGGWRHMDYCNDNSIAQIHRVASANERTGEYISRVR